MGRLVLNVLLSFAQFEREIIAERTRDKMAATRRKGKWSGGTTLLSTRRFRRDSPGAYDHACISVGGIFPFTSRSLSGDLYGNRHWNNHCLLINGCSIVSSERDRNTAPR
jgi:hypothetical protein